MCKVLYLGGRYTFCGSICDLNYFLGNFFEILSFKRSVNINAIKKRKKKCFSGLWNRSRNRFDRPFFFVCRAKRQVLGRVRGIRLYRNVGLRVHNRSARDGLLLCTRRNPSCLGQTQKIDAVTQDPSALFVPTHTRRYKKGPT